MLSLEKDVDYATNVGYIASLGRSKGHFIHTNLERGSDVLLLL